VRLRPAPDAGSFYESFSDLIFGVLAIFVLLSMVFVVLVQSGGRGGEDVAKVQQELETQKEAARVAREQAKEKLLESRETARQLAQAQSQSDALKSAIQTNSLQLAIAVDRTNSMGEGLKALIETLETFADVMAQYATTLEVTIYAYHESQPARYGMKRIHPRDKDSGRSLADFSKFLAGLLPTSNGIAPVTSALREATGSFADPGSFGGAQVLMVVGDVGPFESGSAVGGAFGLDVSSEREAEALAVVRTWRDGSPRRRVIGVYTDKGCRKIEQDSRLEADAVCHASQASREFFRKLCLMSSAERHCRNISEDAMLVPLFRAITK